MTEGVVSKNIRKRCISRSSKAVHNIKLLLLYSEFTVHMQNQLKAGSFVGSAGLSHDVQVFSYARAMKNERFLDDPTCNSLTHERIGRDFYYI